MAIGGNLEKPNIVIIMGDDIGYSDLGCYGSEIKTPGLDRLASEGLRFSNFYNMAKCEPSRSSLFTGTYQGGKNAVNMVQLFRDAGYYTIHSGKEHFLKEIPKELYAAKINHQSLTFEAMNEFFEPPSGKFSRPFVLNGKEVTVKDIYHEKKPFYKDDAFTDNALRWLEDPIRKKQPFFLYLGYGAGHYPLQARPEEIAKYRGKYLKGWDRLREERLVRLKELKLVPQNTKLSPPSSNINKFRGHPEGFEERRAKIPLYRPWNSLSESEKDELDLEMTVYAAMIDRMDQNISRILKKLDDKKLSENTIVIFLSDNGSCPYDSNRDFDYPPGDPRGFRTLSAAWANLGNTPFRFFKQYGHEGGTNTHCIIRWPKTIKAGTIANQTGHIVDLLPTLLQAAAIKYPEKRNGETTQKPDGHSLMAILKGKTRPEPAFFIAGWTERFRMYREGEWKIVKVNGEVWELYNLKNDPTETENLAGANCSLVDKMAENYKRNSTIPVQNKND